MTGQQQDAEMTLVHQKAYKVSMGIHKLKTKHVPEDSVP